MEIAIIVKIAIIMMTVAVIIEIFRVFKKETIITIKEKTAIVVIRTFKKSNIANFNKRKKYIQINSNIMVFA